PVGAGVDDVARIMFVNAADRHQWQARGQTLAQRTDTRQAPWFGGVGLARRRPDRAGGDVITCGKRGSVGKLVHTVDRPPDDRLGPQQPAGLGRWQVVGADMYAGGTRGNRRIVVDQYRDLDTRLA